MPRITTNQIAMGVGSSSAMVDVSSFVEFDEKVTYSWGKEDEYRPLTPSKWSFVLNNYDGRFTPDNPASPLATTVVEGMQVSWLLGGRLVCGSIISINPVFDGNAASWARVQIVVDDMLGTGSRTNIKTSLADGINQAAGQFAYFSMDGDQNTVYAADAVGNLSNLNLDTSLGLPNANPAVQFGLPPVTGLDDHQVRLSSSVELNYFGTYPQSSNIAYPQTSIGGWGFWFTPNPSTVLTFQVSLVGLGSFIELDYLGGQFVLSPGLGTNVSVTLPVGQALYSPHYWAWTSTTTLSGGVWTIALSMYLDGVLIGTSNYSQGSSVTSLTTAQRQPVMIRFMIGDGITVNSAVVGRLSHTLSLPHEELANGTTETSRLLALDAVVPSMVVDVIPSDMSPQPIGINNLSGSVLDAMNDVIKTEQGYMWTAATGSLLSPSQLVRVRARNRPQTPVQTFDVSRELDNAPSFIRDVTNMLARVDVVGTDVTKSFFDGTVSGRVGAASASETILNTFTGDMEAWGQDRLIRGKKISPRIVSAVVDAMTTPTNRSADLLGLVPGDRVQFTNLPSAQLGFTTWDGWLIGGSESHSPTQHQFTLYFAPAMTINAAQFDAARFAAGGELYLASSATSGATTISVDTLGSSPSSTPGYSLVIDSEIVLVTAVSGTGPWTLTVTRAQNGTTAASHLANAGVGVAEVPGTPLLINWVRNPAPRVNLNDWSVGGSGSPSLTQSTGTGPVGVSNFWATAAATVSTSFMDIINSGVGVNPVGQGLSYPVSVWMQTAIAANGALLIQWMDASNSVISTVSGPSTPLTIGAWVQVTSFGVAPAGAARAVLIARSTAAFGIGNTSKVTGFSLGNSGTYFDGTTTGATWTGAANNSPSVIGGDPSVSRFVF